MSPLYRLVCLITTACWTVFSFAEETQENGPPVFTLETIEVTADAIEDNSSSATRFDAPILDTPQSIDVITEEIIDEQQSINVDEILKNDASISNRGNFGAMSSFSSRGFTLSDYGNYLRNGLLYFFFDTPPVETLTKVEILKGPTSFLYGSGSPGGMINFVTKKPEEEENFLDGGIQTASWDYYRAYADLNQTILDDSAYRINVAYEDTKSFRDEYYRKRELFDFSVGTDTVFNLMFQNTDTPQDTGLVAIGDSVADLPRSTYLNQDWSKTELTSVNANLDDYTDLAYDWTLHSALYYQYVERERILTNLRLTEDSTGDFQYSFQHRIDTWNYYTALFELLGEKNYLFDHKLLFGTTYNVSTQEILETTPIITQTYSIYDIPTLAKPDFGDFKDPINLATYNAGVYVQDVITLHRQWETILGARFDNYVSTSEHLEKSEANNVSPHAALLYKPSEIWSLYTTYSEGFEFNGSIEDSNALNFGEALKPTLSEQIEVGSKLELFNSNLLLSLALFDIFRYNNPISEDAHTENPNDVIVVQHGEQHHQGLEFATQGRINDEWTARSSLMWLDARYSDDNEPDIAGNRPAAAPTFAANVWSEYRFISNYAVNGGVFYEGKRFGDSENTFVLDPYARVDVGTAYYYPMENDQEFIVRLTVENINDVEYYEGHRRTNVTVGAPRSVWVTFEVER